MVARDDEDGNPLGREFEQVGIYQIDDLLRDTGAEEQVPTVDDEIRTCRAGVVEHAPEVGEEIGTAAALLQARPDGVVVAQVGVGEEQEAQFHG